MNLIRTLNLDSPAGVSEARWDGMTDDGVRVANGAYFYEVRSGSDGFRGKILVIE
jgi:flagellar hook assembly protein FlgD